MQRTRLGLFRRMTLLLVGAPALVAIMSVGCTESGAPSGPGEAVVGPEGGAVRGLGGVFVSIPPGALKKDVVIRLALVDPPAAALPAGNEPERFTALTPHGLTFELPITVRVPTERDDVRVVHHLDSPSDDTWEEVSGVVANGKTVSWQTRTFSVYATAAPTSQPPPVQRMESRQDRRGDRVQD